MEANSTLNEDIMAKRFNSTHGTFQELYMKDPAASYELDFFNRIVTGVEKRVPCNNSDFRR